MTAVSDFHRWRLSMLADVIDLQRELADLLRCRCERDEQMMSEALATGRASWQYVDPNEDRRIQELRQTLAAYRHVNMAWRTLEPLDDDGRPLHLE